MLRYIRIVIILLLTAGCATVQARSDASNGAQSTEAAQTTCPNPVRIATWNMENFTVSRADDAATETAVVDVWTTMNADIVALQEIGSPDALQTILTAVEQANGRHYEFALQSRGTQRVGFAWDTAVVTLKSDPVELKDVALSNLRPALKADFAFGNYDFTLVTLHLKAEQTGPASRIRNAQSTILARWLADRPADADPDVIILGDFNDFLNSDGLAPLAQSLYFTTSTLPQGTYSYIGGDFDSLIDHIAVTPGTGAQDEFCRVWLFDTQSVGLSENEFENVASDHVPEIAEFTSGWNVFAPQPGALTQTFQETQSPFTFRYPEGWQPQATADIGVQFTGDDGRTWLMLNTSPYGNVDQTLAAVGGTDSGVRQVDQLDSGGQTIYRVTVHSDGSRPDSLYYISEANGRAILALLPRGVPNRDAVEPTLLALLASIEIHTQP